MPASILITVISGRNSINGFFVLTVTACKVLLEGSRVMWYSFLPLVIFVTEDANPTRLERIKKFAGARLKKVTSPALSLTASFIRDESGFNNSILAFASGWFWLLITLMAMFSVLCERAPRHITIPNKSKTVLCM